MSGREKIETTDAPAAIGPYSQAIRTGDLVFCSGQIALVPETGELLEGSVTDQARQVLENLSHVLVAAGTTLDRAVKCTVFLKDMDDFGAVNEVYAEFFSDPAPARACVEVSALPRDVLVEIDVVALA